MTDEFFAYAVDNRLAPSWLPCGLRPSKDGVTITDDGTLRATYGFVRVQTPVVNIAEAHVTRNYRWWTAGVGKTALMDDLVVRASGCRVVRAAGVQSEMELAFAGVAPVVGADAGSSRTSSCSPARRATDLVRCQSRAGTDCFLIGLAVLSMLSDMADEQPLIFLVENCGSLGPSQALVARRSIRQWTLEWATGSSSRGPRLGKVAASAKSSKSSSSDRTSTTGSTGTTGARARSSPVQTRISSGSASLDRAEPPKSGEPTARDGLPLAVWRRIEHGDPRQPALSMAVRPSLSVTITPTGS